MIRSTLLVVSATVLAALAVVQSAVQPLELARRPAVRQDFDTFFYMAKASCEYGHSVLDYAFLRELAGRDTGARTIVRVTQPPFSIVPFVPLIRLPLARARIVWHFVSLLTLIGVLLVLREQFARSVSLRQTAFAGVFLLALFQPLHHHFENGQTNLLMMLLLASTLALESSAGGSRNLLAGFFLGVAIVSKLFPAVVVPVLVARGRWRTIAWTLATIALLTAAALPLTGWHDYPRYPQHLLDSYYFGDGADVAHNLSLKRSWLRFLDWATPPRIETLLAPAWTLPLCWVYFRAWRERASARSFQLRYWQACLLMSTVMASSWEYHLVFALGAYALIADHAMCAESASLPLVALTVIAFIACSVPSSMVDGIQWMGASVLVWLRSGSAIALVLVLEQMARWLKPHEDPEAVAAVAPA